jgi:hypothetical protein
MEGYMVKVKSFTSELKPFHTMKELEELDEQVSLFIENNQVKEVISVSDTCTTSEGNSIGIIRVMAYELSD